MMTGPPNETGKRVIFEDGCGTSGHPGRRFRNFRNSATMGRVPAVR